MMQYQTKLMETIHKDLFDFHSAYSDFVATPTLIRKWQIFGVHVLFGWISNCDYFDGYCNCDMICDIRGNDNFYIFIIHFFAKHVKMIMVCDLYQTEIFS